LVIRFSLPFVISVADILSPSVFECQL